MTSLLAIWKEVQVDFFHKYFFHGADFQSLGQFQIYSNFHVDFEFSQLTETEKLSKFLLLAI